MLEGNFPFIKNQVLHQWAAWDLCLLAVCCVSFLSPLVPCPLAPHPCLAQVPSPTPIWLILEITSVSHTTLLSSDHLSDLQGRAEGDPRASWDFYSSSVLGKF